MIDKWIVYGLMELQDGQFRSTDPWGQQFDRGFAGPICGPYIGILVGLKGDEKYTQRCLKTVSSPISEEVCIFCKASQSGPLMYTQHGIHAPHRKTLTKNSDFFEHGCRHPCAWLELPGFHIERVLLDWLHVVDLSLTPECAASVAWFNYTDVTDVCHLRVFRLRHSSSSPRPPQSGMVRAKMKGFGWHLWNSRVHADSME